MAATTPPGSVAPTGGNVERPFFDWPAVLPSLTPACGLAWAAVAVSDLVVLRGWPAAVPAPVRYEGLSTAAR